MTEVSSPILNLSQCSSFSVSFTFHPSLVSTYTPSVVFWVVMWLVLSRVIIWKWVKYSSRSLPSGSFCSTECAEVSGRGRMGWWYPETCTSVTACSNVVCEHWPAHPPGVFYFWNSATPTISFAANIHYVLSMQFLKPLSHGHINSDENPDSTHI